MRGCGAVGDLHVVLGAELQVALQPRRAVLRPLPFEAVGEQQDETAGAQPLGLAGGDELVDDDLGAIGEIAELRFPQHERLRVGERIAIFESEHAEFGERTVAHFEAGAVDGGQRDVFLAGLLIDPDGVALAERAPAAVLAGQTHAMAVSKQAAEG